MDSRLGGGSVRLAPETISEYRIVVMEAQVVPWNKYVEKSGLRRMRYFGYFGRIA